MAIVVCNMECKRRSKRKMRNIKYADGRPCYGCSMKHIVVHRLPDPDGDVRRTAGEENMAICAYYEPLNEEDEYDLGEEERRSDD